MRAKKTLGLLSADPEDLEDPEGMPPGDGIPQGGGEGLWDPSSSEGPDAT